jgi:hypothetical protein
MIEVGNVFLLDKRWFERSGVPGQERTPKAILDTYRL